MIKMVNLTPRGQNQKENICIKFYTLGKSIKNSKNSHVSNVLVLKKLLVFSIASIVGKEIVNKLSNYLISKNFEKGSFYWIPFLFFTFVSILRYCSNYPTNVVKTFLGIQSIQTTCIF